MDKLTFESFLKLFPSETFRVKIIKMRAQPEIQVLVAYRQEGRMKAVAFDHAPETWPEGTVGFFAKRSAKVGTTKSALAIELVKSGLTHSEVAKQLGMNQSAVFMAVQRAAHRETCPTCGQSIKPRRQ